MRALLLLLSLAGCEAAEVKCDGDRPMWCICATACTATPTGADVTRLAEWNCEPLCYDKTSDGGALP